MARPLVNLDQNTAISESEQPRELWETTGNQGGFTNAVARGVDQTQSMLYGFANAIGELTGIDAIAEFGLDGIKRQVEELKKNPPKIRDWDDAWEYGEFAEYFIERLGEFTPQLALDIAALASGSYLAKAAIGKALKRKIGEQAFTAAQQKVIANKAKKAGGIALGASMFAQGTGETQTEFIERGIDAPGTALIAGGVKGLIDKVGFEKVMRMSGGSPADGLLKAVLKSARVEATTETIQEIVNLLAIKAEDPTFQLVSEENFKRLRESAIVGGMIGGTVSGARGAAGMAAENYVPGKSKDNPSREPEEDTTAQLKAMADPSSSKDTVVVTPQTPLTPEQEALVPEEAAVIEVDDGSVVITTNEDKAQDIIDNDADEHSRGRALYNKDQGKTGTDGLVVQARDAEGNVVADMNTNATDVETDLQEMSNQAPEGGTAVVTDVFAQQEDRAQRVAEEDAMAEPDPVDKEVQKETHRQAVKAKIANPLAEGMKSRFGEIQLQSESARDIDARVEQENRKAALQEIIEQANTADDLASQSFRASRRAAETFAERLNAEFPEFPVTIRAPEKEGGPHAFLLQETLDAEYTDQPRDFTPNTAEEFSNPVDPLEMGVNFESAEAPVKANRDLGYLNNTVDAFNSGTLEHRTNRLEGARTADPLPARNARELAAELSILYPLHSISVEEQANRFMLKVGRREFPSVPAARQYIRQIRDIYTNSDFTVSEKRTPSGKTFGLDETVVPQQTRPGEAVASKTIGFRTAEAASGTAGTAGASATQATEQIAPLSEKERIHYGVRQGVHIASRRKRALDAKEKNLRFKMKDRRNLTNPRKQAELAAELETVTKKSESLKQGGTIQIRTPQADGRMKAERVTVQSIISIGYDLTSKEQRGGTDLENAGRAFSAGMAALMDAGFTVPEKFQGKRYDPINDKGLVLIESKDKEKNKTKQKLQTQRDRATKATRAISKTERRVEKKVTVVDRTEEQKYNAEKDEQARHEDVQKEDTEKPHAEKLADIFGKGFLWEEVVDPDIQAILTLLDSNKDTATITKAELKALPPEALSQIEDEIWRRDLRAMNNGRYIDVDPDTERYQAAVSVLYDANKALKKEFEGIRKLEKRLHELGVESPSNAGLFALSRTHYFEDDKLFTGVFEDPADAHNEDLDRQVRYYDEETGEALSTLQLTKALPENDPAYDQAARDIKTIRALLPRDPKQRKQARAAKKAAKKNLEQSGLPKHEKEFLLNTASKIETLPEQIAKAQTALHQASTKKGKDKARTRLIELLRRHRTIPIEFRYGKKPTPQKQVLDYANTLHQLAMAHGKKKSKAAAMKKAEAESTLESLFGFYDFSAVKDDVEVAQAVRKYRDKILAERRSKMHFSRVNTNDRPLNPASELDAVGALSDFAAEMGIEVDPETVTMESLLESFRTKFGANINIVSENDMLGMLGLTREGIGATLYKGAIAPAEEGKSRQIYVVYDTHSGIPDLKKTLRHELIGHLGVEAVLTPKEFNKLLDLVTNSKDSTLFSIWNEVEYDYREQQPSERDIAEEVVSRVAEKIASTKQHLLSEVLTKIRRLIVKALRKMGFLKKQATQGDIEDVLYAVADTIRNNGAVAEPASVLTMADTAMTQHTIANLAERSMVKFNKHRAQIYKGVGKAVYTRDGQLRIRSKRLANLISQESGETHKHSHTPIQEARHTAERRFNGDLAAIFKRYSDADLAKAFRELVDEKPTAELSPAAKKLRRFITVDFHGYLAERIPAMDARSIEDYFPRIYETEEIIARKDEAIRILMTEGSHKMTEAEALEALANIEDLQTQSLFESASFMAQTTKIQNTRALRDPLIIKAFVDAGFLNTDPVASLLSYIHSSVKRAEIEAAFGEYQRVSYYIPVNKEGLVPPGAAEKINARTKSRLAIKSQYIEVDGKNRKAGTEEAKQQRTFVKRLKDLQKSYYERRDAIQRDHEEGKYSAPLKKVLREDEKLRDLEDAFHREGGTEFVISRMIKFKALRENPNTGALETYAPTGKLRRMVLTDPELERYTKNMTPEDRKREYQVIKDLITGSLETKPIDRNSFLYKFLGELRAYESLRVLAFSGVASIPETAAIYTRLRSMVPTKEFAKILKDSTMNYKELSQLAKDWGFIQLNVAAAMQQELAGYDVRGRAPKGWAKLMPRNILPHLFKWNGNNMVVNFTRVASLAAGQRFLMRLAETADVNSLHKEYLTELRTNADTVKRWVAAGSQPPSYLAPGSQEHADALEIHASLSLFMNQSVLTPTASDRVSWADHPLGGMIFHLKQFAYKFNKDILGGMLREGMRKATHYDPGSKEATQANMEILQWAAASIGIFIFFGFLSDEIRQRLMSLGEKGSLAKNNYDAEKALGAWVTRSGLRSTPWIDAIYDPTVSNIAFEAGPTISHLYMLLSGEDPGNKLAKSIPGLSQSPTVRRELYELLEDE